MLCIMLKYFSYKVDVVHRLILTELIIFYMASIMVHIVDCIDEFLNTELSVSDFSSKVLQSMVSSIDNKLHWPSYYQFLHSENSSIINGLVEKVVNEFKDLTNIQLVVFDSLEANWSVIRKNQNIQYFICYEHLLKILRNNLEHELYIPVSLSILNDILLLVNVTKTIVMNGNNYCKFYFENTQSNTTLHFKVIFNDLKDVQFSLKLPEMNVEEICEGVFIQKETLTIFNNLKEIKAIELRTEKENLKFTKIINSLWSIPKQDTNYASALCSLKFIGLLQTNYKYFKGLINYLTLMNNIFYCLNSNIPVNECYNNYKIAYNFLKDWKESLEDIYKTFSGCRYFVTDNAFKSVELNTKTLQ
ncbi:hypothetical protein ABK040_012394 [Willaertia magna]